MKQEGQKLIEIPAQRFMSCYGCEFFSQQLVASGRTPTYSANCNHTDFKGGAPNNLFGNLSRGKDDHIITPKGLCPFLKAEPDSGVSINRGTSGMFMKTQIDYDGRNGN